ncbi:MAG TPA: hypothetical protein VL595_25615, partial [Pseudonocardia sp.]|nr:hypothetical protein [Pseudonocardia sp.]
MILQELPEPPLAEAVEAGPARRRRSFSDVAGRRARAMAVLGSAGLLVTGGTLAFSGSPTSDSTTAAPWLAPDPEAEQNWASEANVTLASLDRQLREVDEVEQTWNSLPPQERGEQTPPDVAALAKRRELLQQQRARLAEELSAYQSLRAAKQELSETERHVAGLDKALAEAQQDRRRASTADSGPDSGTDAFSRLRERRSAGDKVRQEQRKRMEDLAERVQEAMSTPLPSGDHATRTITSKVRDLLKNPSARHPGPAPDGRSALDDPSSAGGPGHGGHDAAQDGLAGRGDVADPGEVADHGGILGRGDASGRTSGRGGLPSASGALKPGGLLNPRSEANPGIPSGAGGRSDPEAPASPGAATDPGHTVGRRAPSALGGVLGRGRTSNPGGAPESGALTGPTGAVAGPTGAVAGPPSGPPGHADPRSHRPDVLAAPAPATPELHDSITRPREGVGDRAPGGPLEGLTRRRPSGPSAATSGPASAPVSGAASGPVPGQSRQRSRIEVSPLDSGQDSGPPAGADGTRLGADRPDSSSALPRLAPRQSRPPGSQPGPRRSASDLALGGSTPGSTRSSHQSAADDVIDALPFGAGVKQMARSAVADEIKSRQRKGQLSGGQSSGSSSWTATQRVGPKKSSSSDFAGALESLSARSGDTGGSSTSRSRGTGGKKDSSFSMDDLSSLTQSYASKYSSKSSSKSGSKSGSFQSSKSSSSK